MATKGTLATMLIALTFFGCKGPVQASSTSAGSGEVATTASSEGGASASLSGTRKEVLRDATLNNMDAAEVTIPSKWHFRGVLLQGGKCDNMPYFVFRASSPDGLSYVERLPALSWVWGSGPMAGKNSGDCLPVQKAMSAQELLKYLAATMNVEYVADVAIAPEKNAELQKGSAKFDKVTSMSTYKNHSELAAAMVSYKNGTFKMKGRLDAMLVCHETDWQGAKSTFPGRPGQAPSQTHQCTASVRYLVAPESQFEAVKKTWEVQGMGGKLLAPWFQQVMQRQQEQGNQMLARQRQIQGQQNKMLTDQARQQNAQLQAQHDRFEHSQAVQQHMHDQFMSTMQRGTNMSMNRTQANMNARSTATSDWVDYALDQKTVKDPNTGQVNKVSSSYNNTWVDSSGKTSYQTNDVNANPNGVLPGNWTKQTVTHGDGSTR